MDSQLSIPVPSGLAAHKLSGGRALFAPGKAALFLPAAVHIS